MPHLKITKRGEPPHAINAVLKPELVVWEKGIPPEAQRWKGWEGGKDAIHSYTCRCPTREWLPRGRIPYCACAATPTRINPKSTCPWLPLTIVLSSHTKPTHLTRNAQKLAIHNAALKKLLANSAWIHFVSVMDTLTAAVRLWCRSHCFLIAS